MAPLEWKKHRQRPRQRKEFLHQEKTCESTDCNCVIIKIHLVRSRTIVEEPEGTGMMSDRDARGIERLQEDRKTTTRTGAL